jgi:hypothetical protein
MHELATIPEGRPGLDAKVRKIRQLVEAAKRDPSFRQRAAAIVAGQPQRDQMAEIGAVFEWVRDHVRYLRDPWAPQGLELFTAPALLLADADRGIAAGDCDDHVILASALLETIGYRTRYRIGGMPPDHFRHIWLEVQAPGGWLPLEMVKKDEPIGYDPSHRFPLTLTLDGVSMFDSLGSIGGLGAHNFKRANVSAMATAQNRAMKEARVQRQSSSVVQDRRKDLQRATERAQRTNTRLPTQFARGLQESGSMRAFEQLPAATRQLAERNRGRGGRSLLGDYEAPPSFTNTPQEERWFGFTPSDVWRDAELADDVLGLEGFGSKLKKLRKRVIKTAKKVRKIPQKLLSPKTHLKALRKVGRSIGGMFKGIGGSSGSGGGGAGAPQSEGGQMLQPLPYRDPGATGLAPPSLYDQGASGEPADPWGTWDAQTDAQEVHDLYTPATAAEIGPDMELPGEGEGSYVPTPEWEDTEDPYDDPASGDEGMDYDTMDASDRTNIYETADDGSLGDWLTDLASQVGSTVLSYQQARLQKKAADKGYAPLQFGGQVPPMPTTPVPSVPAQMPNIVVQAPAAPVRQMRPRTAGSSMLGTWGPIAVVGIGAVVLFALVSGSRRSR